MGEDAGGHDCKLPGSDSDSDGEAGDLAVDGDWEDFDAMPAQNVDVRGVSPGVLRARALATTQCARAGAAKRSQ